MSNAPVVAGLRAKRNEITFQIRQLQADLAHIDAAIRLVSRRGVQIPKPPKPPERRGTVARVIYRAFREADGPLSTAQVAAYMAELRGIDASDEQAMHDVLREIGKSLARLRSS